jgi:predicted Zn-dependent peptidase
VKFERATLSNGMEVLADVNEHAVSVAVGFFVRTGARDETPPVSGVSHFLEHMAFKGTETRSADDVNRLFDDIGAKYNAYTSEEHTVYHAAILPEYLAPCIDLLGDLLRPSLRSEDFEVERGVILEEISMYADSPMWSAYDRATSNFFAGHPLGNCILGTKESIGALTVDAMREYHLRQYTPSNVIAAAAGKVDFAEFLARIEAKCGAWRGGPPTRTTSPLNRPGPSECLVRKQYALESIYVMAPAPPPTSDLRFAADLLTVVVGDDTGSRFYWSLVDPGKVESIDMSYHEYEGAGAFLVGASCEPGLAERNLAAIREIFRDVAQRGVSDEELQLAKSKLAARLVLAAERPRNRLGPLAYNWIYRREHRRLEDDLSDLRAVGVADVERLLREYPLHETTVVALGPLEKFPGLEVREE